MCPKVFTFETTLLIDSSRFFGGGWIHDVWRQINRELRRFWFTDINRKSLFLHYIQSACIDVFNTEVTDVRRGCFPFVLFRETIYHSEKMDSGLRLASVNQKRVCRSALTEMKNFARLGTLATVLLRISRDVIFRRGADRVQAVAWSWSREQSAEAFTV